MLQNATPLRKSTPGPPNSSDEHVSCTAPATEYASFQILFTCPTLAIVFGHATKPSRFAHFWQGPQSLAPATRKHIWTSKSGPNPWSFWNFDLEMCFAPQRRALFRQRLSLFRHLNFQKWSENSVLCTFWLRHGLRATTACTFATSQLPKVARTWCVLYILTSTCALRHNGVQFFISHLARWLRTRRFSEPASLEKRSVSRLSYLFAHLHLLSSDSSSSLIFSLLFFSSLWLFHLCFSSVHIVGSLTSKSPPIWKSISVHWHMPPGRMEDLSRLAAA